MKAWERNTWSKRYRRWRYVLSKACETRPPAMAFCDGCKGFSHKCPYRNKARDVRTQSKRAWRKEWRDEL